MLTLRLIMVEKEMPLHEQELPSSVITTFSSYSLIHSEKEKEKKKSFVTKITARKLFIVNSLASNLFRPSLTFYIFDR